MGMDHRAAEAGRDRREAEHSVCNSEKASRDRFEGALQLTEAAYCTTFVSVEKN